MWFQPNHFTLHRRPKSLVAMADGEAWLDALGEQLRSSGKIIPALAAAQAKLADADVADVDELQQEAAA